MTNIEDFLATIDPKTAKRIKTAQETEIERLPLASYGLTEAIGGGVAKGRVAIFYGNQSAGKSLLMQQSIGEVWQPAGIVCAYVDVEGAYDKQWGARIGIKNEEMILIQSKSSGKIEKELSPLITNKIDVVIIDSISDIMPEAFVDTKTGEINDQAARKQMGAQAKAITSIVNGLLYLNEATAIILLSQTTTEIGQTYVKQIPHGGKKVLFAASQIVKLTSSNTDSKAIKGEHWVGSKVFESPIGRRVEGVVEKNKLGKQSNSFEYDMYYSGPEVGIDKIAEVIDEAIKFDVIEKKGAWMNYKGTQYQGRANVVQWIKSEPDAIEEVVAEVAKVKSGE